MLPLMAGSQRALALGVGDAGGLCGELARWAPLAQPLEMQVGAPGIAGSTPPWPGASWVVGEKRSAARDRSLGSW